MKEILRMFSNNSSRQALERQLEWCDHWKKNSYSRVPLMFPALNVSNFGNIKEIFPNVSTFFATILETLRKMTSTKLQN